MNAKSRLHEHWQIRIFSITSLYYFFSCCYFPCSQNHVSIYLTVYSKNRFNVFCDYVFLHHLCSSWLNHFCFSRLSWWNMVIIQYINYKLLLNVPKLSNKILLELVMISYYHAVYILIVLRCSFILQKSCPSQAQNVIFFLSQQCKKLNFSTLLLTSLDVLDFVRKYIL